MADLQPATLKAEPVTYQRDAQAALASVAMPIARHEHCSALDAPAAAAPAVVTCCCSLLPLCDSLLLLLLLLLPLPLLLQLAVTVCRP
jgi:hypothetical protein